LTAQCGHAALTPAIPAWKVRLHRSRHHGPYASALLHFANLTRADSKGGVRNLPFRIFGWPSLRQKTEAVWHRARVVTGIAVRNAVHIPSPAGFDVMQFSAHRPLVCVVVLNFNGREHLAYSLPSILATNYQ